MKEADTVSAITSFSGEYRFLSNFAPVNVTYLGESYVSVEHAYQAAKTDDLRERELFRVKPELGEAISAGAAKRLGRHVTMNSWWPNMKLAVMEGLLRQKFNDPVYCNLLIQTGHVEIVEGNHWGDTFWGQCPLGIGENNLGRLLMMIRDEINGYAL